MNHWVFFIIAALTFDVLLPALFIPRWIGWGWTTSDTVFVVVMEIAGLLGAIWVAFS